ncbi:bacterial Ig-like domain-containing protein [Listeria sp. PSOL-1]|uniref:lectin-like domain-containing protein n=1 Tax=Listeria sp. PSOL-1 TaxID=1844999 RepID=UPI0013D834DE|nr:bacterial Ig-like domain-containing protein [Listeria sp. PSOL-1]
MKKNFEKIMCFLGICVLFIIAASVSVKAAELEREIPAPPEKGLKLDDYFANAVGSGVKYNDNRDLLQMSSGTSQTGAIWSKQKIDVRKPFVLDGFIYLGEQRGSAADGMTFTLQPYSNLFLGKDGQYLGMYNTDKKNFVSLEFDTYFNGDGTDKLKDSGLTGPYQHIGFKNGGSIYHAGLTEIADGYTMSNGSWKELTVEGTPKTSNSFTLSYRYRDVATGARFTNETVVYFNENGSAPGGTNFLDSPLVYWGFTSSTGDKYEVNAMSFGKIPQNASINTKDVTIYEGQNWTPKDNFVSATNEKGEPIPFEDAQITYKDNVNTEKPGKYEITFTYTGEYQELRRSASVTVKERVLTLDAKDLTINQGDKFDPYDKRIGLKAYDPVDGDLTSKIQVKENDVNPLIAGDYHVTYQVKNSAGREATKTITVTVKAYDPWPDGDTSGWKMFSGQDIELIDDPANSILDSGKVFYADEQASVYKIFNGDDALKEGHQYRVTVYFKPLPDDDLGSHYVKVSLKADPSSSEYREIIRTTLDKGTPGPKGYYVVTNTFTVGEDETNPLINVENYRGGYIGSIAVQEIQ